MTLRNIARLAVLASTLVALLACLSGPGHAVTRSKQSLPQTVSAAATTASAAKRASAFSFAWSKRGGWYRYGGNGPSSYDCSGLVYAAYRHAGVSLPRVSGAQRSSGKTVHVSRWKAQRGDLAFVGSGHVEFVYDFNKGRTRMRTYGAHHSGTRISVTGWHKIWHIEHINGAG